MKTTYKTATVLDVQVYCFPINFTRLGDGKEGGHLVPITMDSLPFLPKRMYHVSNVQYRPDRGRHAHYNTTQLITCVSGSVNLTLKDGKGGVVAFDLRHPNTAVLVPSMIWDEVNYADSNSTLLVFCDTDYDADDYINTWDKYIDEYNKTS
jgi:oxalate decarboxylase/phosphoglucose isomerase-like protein (cupin superfamily)